MCGKAVLSGFAAPMCGKALPCRKGLSSLGLRPSFDLWSKTLGARPNQRRSRNGPATTFCAKPCLDAAELRSLRIYIRLQLDSEGNFSYLIVVNNYFLFRRRHGHSATEATRVEP